MSKENKFYILLILIYILNLTSLFSQTIKTKDGVTVGDRKEFISICVSSGLKQSAKLNIGVVEVGWTEYCSCVVDKLMPNITSSEMMEATIKQDMMSLFFKEGNLEIIMNCIEGFAENNENALSNLKMKKTGDPKIDKILRNEAIKSCAKEALLYDEDDIFTTELAWEYCTCTTDKMFAGGYTYGEMMDADNENSDAFNEIVIPCLNEVLVVDEMTELQSNQGYIYGGSYSSRVPLIDYLGMGYKLKIDLGGGVKKYFLLDTGATNIVIDRDTERELILNGVLDRYSYSGKSEYMLANNQTVEAQMAKLKKVKIGDYNVTDVEIAIFDNGSLLCGITFLERFKKWEINKNTNTLLLYK